MALYGDRIAQASNQEEIDAIFREAKTALTNLETEVIGSGDPRPWTAISSSVWTRDADKGENFAPEFAVDGIVRTRDDLRTFSSDVENDPYLTLDLGEERRVVSVIVFLRRVPAGYHDQDYYATRFVNYEITLSRFEYDEVLCGSSGSEPPVNRESVEIACQAPTAARFVTITKKGPNAILDANEVKIRAFPLIEETSKLQTIDASYDPRAALRSTAGLLRGDLSKLDMFQSGGGRDRITVSAVSHVRPMEKFRNWFGEFCGGAKIPRKVEKCMRGLAAYCKLAALRDDLLDRLRKVKAGRGRVYALMRLRQRTVDRKFFEATLMRFQQRFCRFSCPLNFFEINASFDFEDWPLQLRRDVSGYVLGGLGQLKPDLTQTQCETKCSKYSGRRLIRAWIIRAAA